MDRMGYALGQKQPRAGFHFKDLSSDIAGELSFKNIEKLVFTRVNMRRWLGSFSRLRDHQIVISARVLLPCKLTN